MGTGLWRALRDVFKAWTFFYRQLGALKYIKRGCVTIFWFKALWEPNICPPFPSCAWNKWDYYLHWGFLTVNLWMWHTQAGTGRAGEGQASLGWTGIRQSRTRFPVDSLLPKELDSIVTDPRWQFANQNSPISPDSRWGDPTSIEGNPFLWKSKENTSTPPISHPQVLDRAHLAVSAVAFHPCFSRPEKFTGLRSHSTRCSFLPAAVSSAGLVTRHHLGIFLISFWPEVHLDPFLRSLWCGLGLGGACTLGVSQRLHPPWLLPPSLPLGWTWGPWGGLCVARAWVCVVVCGTPREQMGLFSWLRAELCFLGVGWWRAGC